MSFVLDLPALFAIGIILYKFGNHYKIERLSKITIGIIIVMCFIVFSVMLFLNVFNLHFKANVFDFTGNEFMFSYPKIIYDMASGFNLSITFPQNSWLPSWLEAEPVLLPLSPTAHHPASLFVIFLFLLYPVSIYLGYSLALYISKKMKHKKNISTEKKTYENVNSRRKVESPVEDPKYCIVRDPDVRKAVTGAINGLDPSGIKKFVKPGNTVLIKVNICGGIPDNPGSFTSKEVVGYVVDLIEQEVGGNKLIICDADMIWTKFSENAKAIGWYKWVDDRKSMSEKRRKNNQNALADIKLKNLSETELIYFDFKDGSPFNRHKDRSNQEIVSTEMVDANVIISIPKMKTHLLTSVTLGMKNMYGTFPEEDKARFHTEGIDDVIYWVNNAFPPNLTIIDGITGGENIGPLSVRQVVDYNTIIASNSAPTADAIAARLMGYDCPFDNDKGIKHLNVTKKKEIDSRKPLNERFVLSKIHEDVTKPLKEITSKCPKSKDGQWQRPDAKDAANFEILMENILAIPFMESFFNIGADFLLFDLARIPLLKHFNEALLEFLYDIPRFWTHPKKIDRKYLNINLLSFRTLAACSIVLFFYNYIIPHKNGHGVILDHLEWSQWVLLFFSLSIILFDLFALKLNMTTKNLVGIAATSWLVALFVESLAPYAGWWRYIQGISVTIFPKAPTPLFPLFSTPIFIIIIVGISYFIFKPIFSYVGLKGDGLFKFVPFGVITIPLLVFLYLEGCITSTEKNPIIIIYLILGLIGLYYNGKQGLEWNLSIAIVALILGGTMEYLGYNSGFWNYPLTNNFPIFVSLTWPFNTWAACGLAQICGIDMSKAFPFIERAKKRESYEMRYRPPKLSDVKRRSNEDCAKKDEEKLIEPKPSD